MIDFMINVQHLILSTSTFSSLAALSRIEENKYTIIPPLGPWLFDAHVQKSDFKHKISTANNLNILPKNQVYVKQFLPFFISSYKIKKLLNSNADNTINKTLSLFA